jgi:hypothetical protein
MSSLSAAHLRWAHILLRAATHADAIRPGSDNLMALAEPFFSA